MSKPSINRTINPLLPVAVIFITIGLAVWVFAYILNHPILAMLQTKLFEPDAALVASSMSSYVLAVAAATQVSVSGILIAAHVASSQRSLRKLVARNLIMISIFLITCIWALRQYTAINSQYLIVNKSFMASDVTKIPLQNIATLEISCKTLLSGGRNSFRTILPGIFITAIDDSGNLYQVISSEFREFPLRQSHPNRLEPVIEVMQKGGVTISRDAGSCSEKNVRTLRDPNAYEQYMQLFVHKR